MKTEINEWIVTAALAGASEVDIVGGAAQRLQAAGVSLVRSSIAMNLLDPTLDARLIRWVRGDGALEEAIPRTDAARQTEGWTRSPFFFLLESRERSLRRRLDTSYRRGEFPLLDVFQERGVTDYVAFSQKVDCSPQTSTASNGGSQLARRERSESSLRSRWRCSRVRSWGSSATERASRPRVKAAQRAEKKFNASS